MKITLDTHDINTIMNALSVAAEKFGNNARACKEAGLPRLAEHFEMQKQDSLKVAEMIEWVDNADAFLAERFGREAVER